MDKGQNQIQVHGGREPPIVEYGLHTIIEMYITHNMNGTCPVFESKLKCVNSIVFEKQQQIMMIQFHVHMSISRSHSLATNIADKSQWYNPHCLHVSRGNALRDFDVHRNLLALRKTERQNFVYNFAQMESKRPPPPSSSSPLSPHHAACFECVAHSNVWTPQTHLAIENGFYHILEPIHTHTHPFMAY